VREFGEEGDRTNLEAIATWISQQHYVFKEVEPTIQFLVLREHFEIKVRLWIKAYKYNWFGLPSEDDISN
jgi:hypothetical protein